ncbi:endoribonuclease Dicer [Osmia bicornis bicornis]|uniref:endoribonuclease Dicer n=1 Tax=Osmia bicornis bicornis TaxID=1437191 RepID=UPI001EAF1C3A|nr:endoribonuclease Dicer [Osmia bicornis bicornis]
MNENCIWKHWYKNHLVRMSCITLINGDFILGVPQFCDILGSNICKNTIVNLKYLIYSVLYFLAMENNTDDFIARTYQIDLLEVALKQNTIVYLPTGAGKTFIAIMLIKELSADVQRPFDDGRKHTVFIVNTVPLVTQQSEYIKRLTDLSCGAVSGDCNVDFWKDMEWEQQLKNSQVLVMTAQILVDAICHGYMHLSKINLIIFDECHRAVNDHPMRQIMQLFANCPVKEQPRILGLSATLLNSNVKLNKVESIIKSLEVTFQAKVATVNTFDQLRSYYPVPEQIFVKFDVCDPSDVENQITTIIMETGQILEQIVLDTSLRNIESSIEFRPKPVIKKLISIMEDIKNQFLHTGIYGADKSALLHLIQLECLKKNAEDLDTVYILEYLLTQITKCRKLLENKMKINTELERIHNYSCDQTRKLFHLLKNFYNNKCDDQKFCCIIFVRQRFTVKVLYQVLKNLSMHDEEYKFLKPDFVVGFSNNPYKNCKESLCISKWNKEALLRFKNGLSNCIIATDVIDEGIDIPTCTLVIRYNLPMDVRSYIQSKGRARFASSRYVLLLPKNDATYLERYKQFQIVEQYLQQLLVGKTNIRAEPTKNEIKNELYKFDIKPYVVIDKDGITNTVTEQSAIGLINRYCVSLLKSKYVSLVPVWILYKEKLNGDDLCKVSLKLPSIAPLKTVIFGDLMPSINSAKRSAAMKMCIELHKIGGLSNKLIPNIISMPEENIDYLFPTWINEEESEDRALIGTYKKKRHHKLQFPSALYGAFPLPGMILYLHVLHVQPKYSVPHDDNRHLVFYNLLNSAAGFAILSANPMPKTPSFPLFMNADELNVDVKVNYATMTLSEKEIGYLKIFHTLIFSQIIPVIKPFMLFDNYNYDNCFLVVPVDEKWEINWPIIKQYDCIKRIQPSVPFHFKNNDYELSLVIPSYRPSADVYIVTQICDDLTPNSCFPSENFFSYAHYFKEKHGLVIKNSKQPMLEVKTISRKIDYIKPSRMQVESKKRKWAESSKDFKEHLVPELCIRINFPPLYWLKTTLLPSILHRVSQLLIAEDLRYTIAEETKLGLLSNDNEWPPLVITDEDKEESFDRLLDTSTNETIDDSQPESVLNGPEVDVLNIETHHYPWSKDQEPPDLYRNIEEVQLIQIEHYCQFIQGTCEFNNDAMKNSKVHFRNRPSVAVPDLNILLLKDSKGPDPVQIMYALTSKSGQDAFNLERLETLGDSYLKFIVSLFLYTTFPNCNEGPLTTLKGKLIGNRNLYYCGVKKNIPGRMKVDDFAPLSNFIAPAYTVNRQLQTLLLETEVSPNVLYEIQIPKTEQFIGIISETTNSVIEEKVLNWEPAESQTGMEHYLGIQTVADKTVADCIEALIGVYLTHLGIKDTIILLKWLQILPNEIDIRGLLYDISEDFVAQENINRFMPWASNIETKIGYKFQNQAFLLKAFTHPSYTANNVTECYQRLEFLGDAILDFLITCYIYENCGNLNPGELTDLRSALVNNITFACLSVRYGLHTALLAYAPNLNEAINRFVKFQEERDHVVNDELLWILLEEDECSVVEHVDVPKVLGDLYESVIGAIYLDSGKNLKKTWDIIYSLMHKEIDEFSKNIPKQPIRVLYETQGAHPQFLNAHKIEGTNGVMVPLKVTIAGKVKLFHGFGINKKQAKCAVAKQALKSLLST